MSSKKPDDKPAKTTKSTAKTTSTKKKTTEKKKTTKSSQKEPKGTMPKEWKEATIDSSSDLDKGKRRSLISALKRSITTKGTTPSSLKDPMNIVITLSPAKHADIIEYIEETVPAGGRAEWVRDSIRLKMRIERGVYGLNTSGQDTTQRGSEENLQTVFGQFAEVMTKVMTDLRTTQPEAGPRRITPTPSETRARPTPREKPARGGPPQIKKVEVTGKELEEIKPDRPSLDDAIGAIVVVE